MLYFSCTPESEAVSEPAKPKQGRPRKKRGKMMSEVVEMTIATLEEESILTNQQFDAIIKMVLNTIDLTSQDVTTMRKAILDLLIDDKTKENYQKPLKERD
jgi:hypothetical protein